MKDTAIQKYLIGVNNWDKAMVVGLKESLLVIKAPGFKVHHVK